ncbi:hypothetical protein [Bradyrhizobium sp. ARR65]|uniref:hypothetical protein n=1 Tax=Bradyrhizobium sp. ARR65 TaxID=1040989 RepID=UPI0004644427|nr:hypothetical protein [Bradyrhizobium sp. ARR65]
MSLHERAKSTLELLAGYSFGARPIVFICHSLGGLLVKQMMRTAAESRDASWTSIDESCVGVFFLATPHTGSSLADLLKAFAGRFASVHVEKLTTDRWRPPRSSATRATERDTLRAGDRSRPKYLSGALQGVRRQGAGVRVSIRVSDRYRGTIFNEPQHPFALRAFVGGDDVLLGDRNADGRTALDVTACADWLGGNHRLKYSS